MSDFTVTPTSIYPSRSRSSGLRSQDDPASLIITHQNVDSNKISPPLELHTPNKNLLAPPRNIFTAMKSAPNVAVPIETSMCPVSGSSNGDTPGSRVYRPVVPYRGSEIRKPPPLLCELLPSHSVQPLMQYSPSNYFLEENKTLRRNGGIILPLILSRPKINVHCCGSFTRHARVRPFCIRRRVTGVIFSTCTRLRYLILVQATCSWLYGSHPSNLALNVQPLIACYLSSANISPWHRCDPCGDLCVNIFYTSLHP